MNFRVLDYDIFKDEKGRDQAWIHIEINNGEEIWTKAERLSLDDVALLASDKANLNSIAQAMAERALLTRPAEKIEEAHRREIELEEKKAETLQKEIRLKELKK